MTIPTRAMMSKRVMLIAGISPRFMNPAKRKVAAKKPARKVAAKKTARKKAITAPSRATGRAPSKRLKARRSANTKKGYFPNPATNWTHGIIQTAEHGAAKVVARTPDRLTADIIASLLNKYAQEGVRFTSQ